MGTPGTVYWTAGAVNAEGQTTEATLGNGVGTTRSYDAATGLIRTIQSGVGESSGMQDLGYTFDSLGNLTTREDFSQEVYESFAYDRLNRLTGGIVYDAEDDTERESKTYRYDAVGNIVNKSDVGTADYVYGTGNAAGAGDAGPHAVVSAGGNSYAYDDNGNMISGDGRTLTWTSFNKPKTVVNGTTHTRFDYGPERARTRQVKVQGANTTTIKYVGTLFEQVAKTGAATEYVNYVFAGERRVAVYATDNAPTPREAVQYLHQDPPGVGGYHHGRERRGGGAAVVRCVGEAADGVGGGCLEGLGDPDHGGDHATGVHGPRASGRLRVGAHERAGVRAGAREISESGSLRAVPGEHTGVQPLHLRRQQPPVVHRSHRVLA